MTARWLSLAVVIAANATAHGAPAAPILAAASAAASASTAPDPTPLLTYATSQHFPPVIDKGARYAMKKRLDRITFDLSKDPPPEANCAQTLGAKRFSFILDDLGGAYSNMGDDAKAADAFAKAIECNPRAGFLHAELAASLLDLGRYSDARVETQRQLSLGRANFTFYALITQLDFIENRWPEAVTNARQAATEAPDDEQATYWQCFLWLAQKHVSAQEPVLVKRRFADSWPGPILQSLQGKITEAELVESVKAESDSHRQREILSEALFYTGEKWLAANRLDEAAGYFAASADLKVLYFIEHHLAMAELSKLRHRGGPEPTPPTDSEAPPPDQKL